MFRSRAVLLVRAATRSVVSRVGMVSVRPLAARVLVAGAAVTVATSVVYCDPAPVAEKAIAQSGDSLKPESDWTGTYEYLKQTLAQDPDNVEVLWRFARAAKNVADKEADKTKKQALTFAAHDAAKRAVELAPTRWECHYWYAITLKKAGDFLGSKEAIKNAFLLKEHFLKAAELNPSSGTMEKATIYNSLGQWALYFAEMSWLMRSVASTIFASPPTATVDEALSYFLKAEETCPGFYINNQLSLAKVYNRLGKKDEAKAWAKKAAALPVLSEEDKADHAEAVKLAAA